MGMRLRIGLGLGGRAFSASASPASARLGEPTWSPLALLRDLELRLGLAPVNESTSARLPAWMARITSLADEQAFYARSFATDPLGTSAALLEWRDALVEAGWDGAPIIGGGDRLDAISRLERHDAEGMPLGHADRLCRVQRALTSAPSRLYEAVSLLDDRSLWPGRWQSVFAQLEAFGTAFSPFAFDLPGAPTTSDLGVLQAHLRGTDTAAPVRGDGSLLILRGDTPGDLAELTAALLAKSRAAGALDVVVRGAAAASLEAALARQGLPAQGHSSESAWRPAMQVLPLAVELAFEPRDPYRLLELLTLPVGPFRGAVGARLARAVARQPGVGGKEWTRQKAQAARVLTERRVRLEREGGKSEAEAERAATTFADERMRLVAEWLEGPGVPPRGASRAELLAVVDRVAAWLERQLRASDASIYRPARAQTASFREALAQDPRDLISQEDARQLLDRFARTELPHDVSIEAAGRIARVDHPSALLAPCDRVVFWGAISAIERRPPRLPWAEEESAALARAGVIFPEPAAWLRAEAQIWRRALLAARQRVVFVVPRTIKGTATAPHSLWEEVVARLALDERAVARLTRDARGGDLVQLETCAPLRLPDARAAWSVPAAAIRTSHDGATSVTALEKIATCPLAWVLEHRAELRSGAMSKIATGALLNGGLGHRLVEALHEENAFDLAEDAFLTRAAACFEALLQREGTTLLLAGASTERLQLTRQMQSAMRDLYRYLARSGYRIKAVEEVVTTDSAIGPLEGRLDLRLGDAEGRTAILDLKWGASKYRTLLAAGRAVQLAAYARALAEADGEEVAPPAAYFALSRGEVVAADPRMRAPRTIEGPSLEATWLGAEATAKAVHGALDRGVVHVCGTKGALPLLDALGIAKGDRAGHFEAAPDAACEYCAYDALCGRKWEALA